MRFDYPLRLTRLILLDEARAHGRPGPSVVGAGLGFRAGSWTRGQTCRVTLAGSFVHRGWLNGKSLLFPARSVGGEAEGCSSTPSLSAQETSPRSQRHRSIWCFGFCLTPLRLVVDFLDE